MILIYHGDHQPHASPHLEDQQQQRDHDHQGKEQKQEDHQEHQEPIEKVEKDQKVEMQQKEQMQKDKIGTKNELIATKAMKRNKDLTKHPNKDKRQDERHSDCG